MKPILAVAGLGLALAACQPAPRKAADNAPKATPAAPQAAVDVPAGDYALDPAHSTLLFRADHLSFSKYVGRFETFDASLYFDPKAPETSRVEVTVDAKSLGVSDPPAGFLDDLRGPQWLDAGKFPTITFKSTKVEATGARTARITGDFTLRGVTRPLVLEAKFNGGYRSHPYEPRARIGFSATGTLDRSDYGIDYGLPEPGTTMGVGDAVEVAIEAEFTGPPSAPAR